MSGKKTINNTTPAIGAIKIQQSTYGVVIPIVWGRTRVSGNLIWYGDFKSVPHTEVTQQGGKGGGGAPQQTTTTYTYQASVAMALCEGPVLGVRTAWRGKNIYEGSTYSGSTRSSSETRTIPTGGARTVTVSNTNGWVPVSVELRVSNDFDDGFRYNRRGSWMTLTPGDDFTASAGVYTFGGGDAQPGDTVRITYTYVSNIPSFSCLAQIGLDLFNGTPGQQPWTYLSSRHPDQALGYSGIAYVAGANYSLDGSASVENHAFEIETSFMTSASVPDADPSLIAADALTNPQYGAQFGREKLGDMSDYSKACLAQGIVLSPALTEQMSASAFLDQLSGMTNVGLVWSGGALKFIPYTDMPVTGNGVTFTPITTPIYDLTDDDFQPVDDEGPVKVNRGAVSDSFNSVKLEYFDRANDYNIAIMEQADQADIQENGPRPMPVMTAHWITEAAVAKIVATLVLQRSLFIRNTYEFKLGWTKIALEPMDLVTITDPNLGMDKLPVRILSIEESDDGYLSVVAEDFPKGSASATLYPSGSGGGFTPNFNEPPGAPLAPVIFEGPSALANSEGGLEVWLATGSTSPTYGGCEVWVSLTGSDYRRAATLNGKSRFGVTTGILPAAQVGATTTDSLGVQLSSGGQLLAATATDMAALVTLCYVGGEFFSYETSTLTGASAYTLGGHMVRGAYLSNSAAHASGSAFVRCDDAIAKVQLTPDYIGRTIHIKLLPFNRYGGAVGSLSDATEYTYTVSGLQANQAPIAPRNLGVEGPFTATTAKFRWDRIGNAASYNVQVWAGSPAAKVREVNVGDSLRYDYSAADAKSDGGPWRTLTVKVQGIHANGAVGAFSTFTATNPQVGALTGVAAASGPRTVQFACDRPSDADYSGILVWLSATSGFTPDASTLVFDGPDTNVTINRLKGGAQLALGATYYVRAAAYDSYDKNGLTISPEVAVVIENTTGVQTAIIQLYKWSTAAPAKPTGSSTFTWATGANAGYAAAPADGWLVAPGSNPGTPGASLWIATVQIAVPTGTTTSTVDYTNSTVGAWSQNGMNGSSGVNNGAATVFRWSATVPQGPAGAATYKWSDGSFGAAPTSPDGSVWGLTSGAPPSAGMTLWAAKVTVVDSAANAQTGFNWSSAAIMAIGTAGSNGQAGASYVTAYCASATGAATSAPAATTGKASLPATNSGGITGAWSAAVPTLANNQYLYQSDGIYDPATDKVTWSTPYWSSLKVGTLSAISANLGAITGGSLNIGNGKFTVDASGNVTMSSFLLVDPNTGKTILQAGGVVGVDFLPTSVKNSELVPSINSAATTANWDTGITGTKKPQDNATVGAPTGTMVGGTLAQTVESNAAAAKAATDAIASDAILSKGEKRDVVQRWQTCDLEWASIRTKAAQLGVGYSAYDTAHSNLAQYLSNIPNGWSNVATDSPIDPAAWKNAWNSYYDEKQALINAMTAKAATTANADGSIRTPAGAMLNVNTGAVDGAIKIRLPQSWTNTMMKFTVDIYEYSTGYSCTLDVSGYNYTDGAFATGGMWYNVTARVVGGSNVEYPVYFGHDGTKCCIWIGNANETWMYPQVQVRDFLAGYSNISKALWESGWSISFDTAAATYVSASVTDTLPGADWSKIPNKNGRPQDWATVGATIGTNLYGQITPGNASTYIASAAIQSAMVADLRTANYAEDGSGVVTAGAKLASAGTAIKVANSSFQIGSAIFTDYWARLVYAIDGNASSALIWRGNNDSTVRAGTANIACLAIQPLWSAISADNVQTVAHRYTITPTSYSAFTDNLDSLTNLYIQWFGSTTDNTPFSTQYLPIPSRVYNNREGSIVVDGVWGWRFSGVAAQTNAAHVANGVYNGYQRVAIGNVYGFGQAKDFGPGTGFGSVMGAANITGGTGGGAAPPPAAPEGGGTSGGNCPAPWVPVRLANGKEVCAGDLHNGARVAAVDDTTMLPIEKGGVVQDLAIVWAQRYRVKLADGTATEWSENHRLAVNDRGWVEVQNIRPGDHILGMKECIVESVMAVGRGQVVSFIVQGAGTYFGGGLLSHNRKYLP